MFLWGALPLFLLLEIHYEHLHALSVLLSVHASYAASFLRLSCPLSGQTLHYLIAVAKHCRTLCDPMDCSMPGSSVLHCLQEFDEYKLSLYSLI